MTPYEELAGAREATGRVLERVAGLTPARSPARAGRPGWTRAHVLAHVPGNAAATCGCSPRPAGPDDGPVRRWAAGRADDIELLATDPGSAVEAFRSSAVDLDAGYAVKDWPSAGPTAATCRRWAASSPTCQSGPDTHHHEETQVPYTGEVTVGGPPDVRETPALTITKVATPPFTNNCYLLRCTATGATLLVDAAGDAPQLLALGGDRLVGVVQTHDHWDHVQALAEVTTASGAPVLAHEADADDLPVPTDRRLQDGDTIAVGDCALSVLHLEGHTPGSIALLYEGDAERPHLFSGDSLFPGGHGRTTTLEEHIQLMDDLARKVFGPLPDTTWVYPGHGKDTTLGAERPSLQEWRERGW